MYSKDEDHNPFDFEIENLRSNQAAPISLYGYDDADDCHMAMCFDVDDQFHVID